MPHLRLVVAICAALLSIAVLAPAAHAADGLTSGALYEAGPDGRYLMGGDWLFRLDSADQGLQAALHAHDEHRRLGGHEGPQRLERHRHVERVDGRVDRLVPQGLPPARAPTSG